MALVKFVKNDGSHALEIGIGKQAPREYALGNKSQARTRTNYFFEPDLISNALPDLLGKFRCDSTRGKSGRNPSWFEHNYFPAHNF
jgi:hypothetical protein